MLFTQDLRNLSSVLPPHRDKINYLFISPFHHRQNAIFYPISTQLCLLLCSIRCFVCLYAFQHRSITRPLPTVHPTLPPPIGRHLPTSRNPEDARSVAVDPTNRSMFSSSWVISARRPPPISLVFSLVVVFSFPRQALCYSGVLFLSFLRSFCRHLSFPSPLSQQTVL